jgi:hypothetical protein
MGNKIIEKKEEKSYSVFHKKGFIRTDDYSLFNNDWYPSLLYSPPNRALNYIKVYFEKGGVIYIKKFTSHIK